MNNDSHGHVKEREAFLLGMMWQAKHGPFDVGKEVRVTQRELDETETWWNYCVELCGTISKLIGTCAGARWNHFGNLATGLGLLWRWNLNDKFGTISGPLGTVRMDRVAMFRQKTRCAHAMSRKTCNQDITRHLFLE